MHSVFKLTLNLCLIGWMIKGWVTFTITLNVCNIRRTTIYPIWSTINYISFFSECCSPTKRKLLLSPPFRGVFLKTVLSPFYWLTRPISVVTLVIGTWSATALAHYHQHTNVLDEHLTLWHRCTKSVVSTINQVIIVNCQLSSAWR